MKKILFIDRDGTLVLEPPDFQVDSLEKLEFYPEVFQYLSRIVKELEYELVMVSNQDGLGTQSFSEETFIPVQEKIIRALENENIFFSEILIDKGLPEDNAPTRKPGTAMLTKYLNGNYDIENSFVIGDRFTDVELAINIGCKSISISKEYHPNASLITTSWRDIYNYLKAEPRKAVTSRKTQETNIDIEVNLDGSSECNISTGINFFNHLLSQLPKHGNIDLKIMADGDLKVDEHHTIEDVAITLGKCFSNALGSKKGIERYGFVIPMDDSLAKVVIDFGGRPYLVWKAEFKREKIGDMPTEMFKHFFKSFSDNAMCNLNISVEGENEHHKIESIFKAFAKTIKMAVSKTDNFNIPSTKGIL